MNNCIFCKIINNEIPSYTLYEDEMVKVFLDINPERPGHTLIIPKTHFVDINDISIETLNHISLISKKTTTLLKEKLNYDGLRLVQNNGVLEEVKHYHLHLIPVYKKKQELIDRNVIFEKIMNVNK